MNLEAMSATEKAKALQQVAHASAEIAAAKEKTRQQVASVFTVTAKLEKRAEASEKLLQKQRHQWFKMMVSTLLLSQQHQQTG